MTKIVARVFIVMLFVFCKSLTAQTDSSFQQAHTKLLDDYILFIDSVEKKHLLIEHYPDIYNRKHIVEVKFCDDKFVYEICKKVKVYKSGLRYEKITWKIWYHHYSLGHPFNGWPKKIYEIKLIGNDYRFIEQVQFEFGKRPKRTKITTSYDDNYLSKRILRPKDQEATYFYVKPMSSIPRLHQD
jgi:hypothetical protein